MLGYIEGDLVAKEEAKVIVKAGNGLGYEIFYQGDIERRAVLFITQIFKEKAVELYGFQSLQDKKQFELLLSVNGVGPKSAYSLVSTLGMKRLNEAILFEDVATIKKAPGIGPKAAKQIILDLKEKIGSIETDIPENSSNLGAKSFSSYQEAIIAFKELGFGESEIMPLIKTELKKNAEMKSEELIKNVLKQLNH